VVSLSDNPAAYMELGGESIPIKHNGLQWVRNQFSRGRIVISRYMYIKYS